MIKDYQYQSDFARKYYGQGLEAGKEAGKGEGLRAAVVALVRAKLDEISDDDLAKIAAVTDPGVLTELITALAQTRSASDTRAALVRALHRKA